MEHSIYCYIVGFTPNRERSIYRSVKIKSHINLSELFRLYHIIFRLLIDFYLITYWNLVKVDCTGFWYILTKLSSVTFKTIESIVSHDSYLWNLCEHVFLRYHKRILHPQLCATCWVARLLSLFITRELLNAWKECNIFFRDLLLWNFSVFLCCFSANISRYSHL